MAEPKSELYELKIIPIFEENKYYYKVIAIDLTPNFADPDQFQRTVRDIFRFDNFNEALKAMAAFSDDGCYPESS